MNQINNYKSLNRTEIAKRIARVVFKRDCYFHHGDSFTTMDSEHIDICVLNAFQIAENGEQQTISAH